MNQRRSAKRPKVPLQDRSVLTCTIDLDTPNMAAIVERFELDVAKAMRETGATHFIGGTSRKRDVLELTAILCKTADDNARPEGATPPEPVACVRGAFAAKLGGKAGASPLAGALVPPATKRSR